MALPKYQLQRLQYICLEYDRVVCKAGKFHHITPVLSNLQWLLRQCRISFQDFVVYSV